jgi:antitoxin MazE
MDTPTVNALPAREAAELDLKLWGNSLGVRIPAAIARSSGLKPDQRVRLSVEQGRVVITPVENAPLTLAQRLALFDPKVHGGEAMASPHLGAERW